MFSDFREPKDIDWVTNDVTKLKKSIIGKEEYYFIPNTPDREMTADEIYTIKVSHAIYDINWKKTMSDIRFLQMKGCKLIPEFLTQLRSYWETVHGVQHRTDFEVKPGQFFDDRVKRKLNHDDLHKMLNPVPTYLKMIVNDVNPSPDKFLNDLTDDERKEVLYEEAFVIAMERLGHLPTRAAYNSAQQSLVTKLHPVWLADFIIEHWNDYYWNATNSKFYEQYKTIKN
jgi:hypothetical protein